MWLRERWFHLKWDTINFIEGIKRSRLKLFAMLFAAFMVAALAIFHRWITIPYVQDGTRALGAVAGVLAMWMFVETGVYSYLLFWRRHVKPDNFAWPVVSLIVTVVLGTLSLIGFIILHLMILRNPFWSAVRDGSNAGALLYVAAVVVIKLISRSWRFALDAWHHRQRPQTFVRPKVTGGISPQRRSS